MSTTATNNETAGNTAQAGYQETLAGKYLSFFLGHEEYGIAILKVREIIGMVDVTPLPRTPDFVRGVINLRGRIIPVVDLRLKFGMEPQEYTEDTCVVVVDVERDGAEVQTGCIVDNVSEVLNIETSDIEAAPRCARVDADFITGLGKLSDRVMILLEIDRVLDILEVQQLKEAVDHAEATTAKRAGD